MADGPRIHDLETNLQDDALEELQNQQDSLMRDVLSHIEECRAAVKVAKEREERSNSVLAEATEDLTATEMFTKKLEAAMSALGTAPAESSSTTSGRGKLNAQKSHQLLVAHTQERLGESLEELRVVKQRYEQACRIADIAKYMSMHAIDHLRLMKAHNLEVSSILNRTYTKPAEEIQEVLTMKVRTCTYSSIFLQLYQVYWNRPGKCEHEFIISPNSSIESSLRLYSEKPGVKSPFPKLKYVKQCFESSIF